MLRSNLPTQERIRLMIAAIREAAPPGHPLPAPRSQSRSPHTLLLEQYLPELERSTERALERWAGLLESMLEDEEMTQERAEHAIRLRSPAGPGEDSEFIATVRRYWLRCSALNETLPAGQRVPPEEFLLLWPAQAGERGRASVDVLSQLTYLPVGLDREGRWA